MAELGSHETPLQIAVVGSGPSGFYAAEALLRRNTSLHVDMFERLPTPFGLVRAGVAPDHPKIKQVILVYDRIAKSPGFNFFGNVTIGEDLTLDELRDAYHAVIIAYGAHSDRRLGISGEDLPRSYTATEFVAWYNGHPDYRDRVFDLSHERAVIIGQGNVAADVARILATPVEELRCTDITSYALTALSQSRIWDIVIVGRRGPAQAKFTAVELKELGKITNCNAIVEEDDLVLGATCLNEVSDSRGEEAHKNVEIFRSFVSHQPDGSGQRRRTIRFRFLETPIRIEGTDGVERLILGKNTLSGPPFAQKAVVGRQRTTVPCGIVFRSVGYRGLPLAGLEFDSATGTIPNCKGRCLKGLDPISGAYVTGWIKRGPTGIIGTNRADSMETVESVLEDLSKGVPAPKPGGEMVRSVLAVRGVHDVSYSGWQAIDTVERERGMPKGKPREKMTSIPEMVEVASGVSAEGSATSSSVRSPSPVTAGG